MAKRREEQNQPTSTDNSGSLIKNPRFLDRNSQKYLKGRPQTQLERLENPRFKQNEEEEIIYGKTRNRVKRVRQFKQKLYQQNQEFETKGKLSKIRVTKALFQVIYPILWLAGFQLFFGLLALIGYGIEKAGEEFAWGLFSWVIPGIEIFLVAYFITVLIAFASMLIAGALFFVKRINWLDVSGITSFIVAIALGFVPFLNIISFAALWVGFVWYTQITK